MKWFGGDPRALKRRGRHYLLIHGCGIALLEGASVVYGPVYKNKKQKTKNKKQKTKKLTNQRPVLPRSQRKTLRSRSLISSGKGIWWTIV